MLRLITDIQIVQQPSPEFPEHNKKFNFDFCHEYESEDSWESLTNNGKLTFPRNTYVMDENNKPYLLGVTNTNLGGFSNTNPVFLRGDKVTIAAGYKYFNEAKVEVTEKSVMFTGYISKVGATIPVELELEDNMWLLKQAQALPGVWTGYTIEDMLRKMIAAAGLPFTVHDVTRTNAGRIMTTAKQTICEVLQMLKKQFNFHSYFRGNELRCGSFVYIEGDAQNPAPIFKYKQNIISDELEYSRKDDLTLSAIAHNTVTEETGQLTKDGHAKTKRKRLEVLVTFRRGKNIPDVYVIQPGQGYPENTEGERHEFFYPGAKTIDELTKLATNELKRYYYTGLRGKFTTFGIPFVKQGDNVDIINPTYPEACGRYKVKAVRYTGGVNGLRQEIQLHYQLFALDANGKRKSVS